MSKNRFLLNASYWKEWVAVLAISASVCVASSIPYLAGWYAQTSEFRYAWVGVIATDTLTYFAKMGQGQEGQWLFHLPYTAQTHSGIPIYTYYLFLGHLSHWLALPIPIFFHLARVLNGLILLTLIYIFIRKLTEDEGERRFILTLVAISSGLGWLAVTIGQKSADINIPESNTFYTLMDNPHFPLSQALLLLLASAYLLPPLVSRKHAMGSIALIAFASMFLASLQPQMIVIAWGIGVFYSAWLWWDTRSIPQTPIMFLTVSVLAGGTVLGVIALALNSEPLFQALMVQDITLSPSITSYLSGYGLLLIPAIYGAIWAMRAQPQAARLMIVWCTVTLLAVYAPTTIQRRFVSGVHIPLAILAGLGICRVWIPRCAAGRWTIARLSAWMYIVFTSLTSILLVAAYSQRALAHSPYFFLSASESQALAWLSKYAPPDGVVLASSELGAFVPAFTTQRVVVGHWAETVDFAETSRQVQRFFSTAISSSAICDVLTSWGADYVLIGPRERSIGAEDQDFAQNAGTVQVAHFTDVSIYQVNCP